MELETIKKEVVTTPVITAIESPQIDPETEMIVEEEAEIVVPTATEEIRVVTSITLPSRKLKIKISNELLHELEKMQLNFKLN